MRPLSFGGAATAALIAPLAAVPSLVPRAAVIQGLLLALAAATGYAAGAAAGCAIRLGRRTPDWHAPRWARMSVAAAGAVWLTAWLLAGLHWQRELALLMATTPPAVSWVVVSVVAALPIALLLLLLGRLLLRAARGVRDSVGRRTGEPAASLAVAAAGIVIVVPLANGMAATAVIALLDPVFQSMNSATSPGVVEPRSRTVSGGPNSAVTWDSLGHDGRDFISRVTPEQKLKDFSGGAVESPVRVYVGVAAAATAQQRAQLAVADLQRFGGFERAVLAVGTSTGTGTVDESAVGPLELMYGGDTATVSTQYSVLPSFLSFLFDQAAAEAEARALFDAVHGYWSTLPTDRRPLLVVFGESLGAYGATAPFADLAQFAAQVDGALMVGPPNATPFWWQYTSRREPGSLERLPVYGGGRILRWAGAGADYTRPPRKWDEPRLAYLQNASDPVVWWSPSLLWARPDWLAEPRGPDVLPDLQWLPLITFLGLGGDMIDSQSVPAGHGHVYGASEAVAWTAVIPPPGWDAADTQRLAIALGG